MVLHCAATNGREAIVKLLLENGTEVDARCEGGETALHCAAIYGHGAVVKLLLEKGVAVGGRDEEGRTALRHAARARRR